jgi:hypothetical protein
MVRRWRLIGYFPILYNPAYDTCVGHYQMCAKGYYEPETTPLMMDVAALDKPGRGGPLSAPSPPPLICSKGSSSTSHALTSVSSQLF